MKILSLVFFVTFVATVFFSNCSSPPETPSIRTDRAPDRDMDRDSPNHEDRVNTSLCPAEPDCKASGESCCELDRDCKKDCGKYFSGSAKKACYNHPLDIAEDVFKLLEKLEEGPSESQLSDIETDTLCYVLDLSPDHWESEISGYSKGEAKTVLKWLVDENISQYFGSDEHDLQEIVEELLAKLGGGSDESDLLTALVDTDIDDTPIIFYLFENDQSDNYHFYNDRILNSIIDEQICEPDSNRPIPLEGCTGKYGLTTDTPTNDSDCSEHLASSNVAKDNDKEACMLAVFCKPTKPNTKSSDRNNYEKYRKSISTDTDVDTSNITDFVELSIYEGGLNNDQSSGDGYYPQGKEVTKVNEIDKPEHWSDETCCNLNRLWRNYSTTPNIDLGLGDDTQPTSDCPP